jgi:spectinomycin phosphotransferase
MLINHLPSNKHIMDCLQADYGIHTHTLTLLPLGADMNSSVYKAEAKDQSAYFVKLKQGIEHHLSFAVLDLLQHAHIPAIIPPILTKHHTAFQLIDDFTLIVHPFIEGKNGFTQPLTDAQWVTLGKCLRQVHDLAVPTAIKAQLRQERFSPKWRQIVKAILTQLESNPGGDEITKKLLAFMRVNLVAIHRLVDRSEELAQKLMNESHDFVLCHSDIHAGNVLINNNKIYIVDWDDPIMAPKERDLMFIGGGVGNVWNNSDEVTRFYKGYGQTYIHMPLLAYYRHERIVEDIAEYAQALLLKTDGYNRPQMYQHFIDMFEPKGVVEIAFQTDDIGY